MLQFLNNIPAWFGKVIDLVRGLISAWYIRRSTRIETEKEVLEDANIIKSKQNEIAARPPVDPDDIRQRMRDNQF